MEKYVKTVTSNFEEVISIVDRSYISLKKTNKSIEFFKFLESVYHRCKHLNTFKVFDSVDDFKSKILSYYNKRKADKKRKKQKAPPSGISNWEIFWENW